VIPGETALTGRYVYCLAAGRDAGAGARMTGLDGRPAYAVAIDDISAIVHDCPDHAYDTADDHRARAWVLAHHRVVELAWRRWEAVLPMTFNTIVAAGGDGMPERRLRAWVEAERAGLAARLDDVRGRAEYGLQVLWSADRARRSAEVPAAAAPPAASPGLAYLQRQGRARDARRQAVSAAEELVRSIAARAAALSEQVRIERPGDAPPGLQMVVNVSCLVTTGQEAALAALAAELRDGDGQEVRLVGPLPAYSFAR
jgi:hypothetical protein